MGIENSKNNELIQSLEDAIKVDGKLTASEKQAFLLAYNSESETVLTESHKKGTELRNFILCDYGEVSKKLVGKAGIQQAQELLGLPADGVFGPKTFQSTIEFQKNLKQKYPDLKIDGIIGPETMKIIKKELSSHETTTDKPQINIGPKKSTKEKTTSTLSQKELVAAGEWIQSNLSSQQVKALSRKLNLEKGSKYSDLARKVTEYQQSDLTLNVDGKPGKLTLKALGIRKVTLVKTVKPKQSVNVSEKVSSSLSQRELVEAGKWIQSNLSLPEIKALSRKLNVKKGSKYSDLARAVAAYQETKKDLVSDGKSGKQTLRSLGITKTTAYSRDITKSNKILEGLDNTGSIEVPEKWKVVFGEFLLKARSNRERKEILSGKYPVAMTDSRTKRAIIIMGKKTVEFPIILGSGIVRDKNRKIIERNPRVRNGWSKNDHSTCSDEIFRFDQVRSAKKLGGKVPGGTKTMRDTSIDSPESRGWGGKHWHGVSSSRIPNGATWGCVGMPEDKARLLGNYVKKKGKGFGFISKV